MYALTRIAVLMVALAAPAAFAAGLTDLAGRAVQVPVKVERVLLGEGRFLPALAILDRQDPARRVVGMLSDFETYDPAGYAQYQARFPQLDRITRVGRSTGDSFSVEQAIALSPDLAIFGLEGHGPSPNDKETIRRLEKAGIPIVFIDFRHEPLRNTPRSIELLGELLGRQTQAREFVEFYDAALQAVAEGLREVPAADKPVVFIENRVGLSDECCTTMVNGMMGRFVDYAGGRNLAAGKVPGAYGTVHLEYLLTHQPDIYVGTAIGSAQTAAKTPGRIVLGAGVTPEVARASLQRALQRRGIAELSAVRAGRAYAVWHHFYNSPFNVAAVQAFAKWLYPERFAELDPDATLAALYERFQPVPLDGIYWIGLRR